MKKGVLLLLLLSACFANPYVQPADKPELEAPVGVVEKNDVIEINLERFNCWNGSTVLSESDCPKKPQSKIKEEKDLPKVHIAQSLILKANEKFDSYAYRDGSVLVIISGDHIRYLFDSLYQFNGDFLTDIYIDRKSRTALGYCNIDREARMFDNSFDYERSKCRDYLNSSVSLFFDEWNPRDPLSVLEEFANIEPVLVETALTTIGIGSNSKAISPTIHYEVRGKKIILRIDRRYHVPVKVEEEGVVVLDFRDIYFDVMVVDGKQNKITSDWVVYKSVSDYWLKGNTK